MPESVERSQPPEQPRLHQRAGWGLRERGLPCSYSVLAVAPGPPAPGGRPATQQGPPDRGPAEKVAHPAGICRTATETPLTKGPDFKAQADRTDRSPTYFVVLFSSSLVPPSPPCPYVSPAAVSSQQYTHRQCDKNAQKSMPKCAKCASPVILYTYCTFVCAFFSHFKGTFLAMFQKH